MEAPTRLSLPSAVTFADDKLGLQEFCNQLEKFLIVEHTFVDGSLVVGLDAPFGSGKTTFLTMWRDALSKKGETDVSVPITVMLNAWEGDYCGDPLLAVITGLLRAVENQPPEAATRKTQRLREAAKDAAWFCVGLGNELVSAVTGIRPKVAGELAEQKKEARNEKPDFVALYEKRVNALRELKSALTAVLGGESPRAFVFVDELDRCRPDYAISYLETLKHIFDVHGLIFVLAVDHVQLASSAKALFGQDLNFAEYFRKFVHRSFSLPEPNESDFDRLASALIPRYLEKDGVRACFLNLRNHQRNIVQLTKALRMNPRQIHETFRIIGHVFECKKEESGRLLFCLGMGALLMTVLKVKNSPHYRTIGKGLQNHAEVGRFIVEILGRKNAHWWLQIYITGVRTDEEDSNEMPKKFFTDLGFLPEGAAYGANGELGQFLEGWGRRRNGLQQVYAMVESATSFGKK